MNSSPTTGTSFPLFICGLPRAGTSFLFAVLSEHPAFANGNFKDKELRYFEKLIGNRPWNQVEGVSQKKFEGIDADILPVLLRALDERLRATRGGPQGHYINANPRDVFLSRILLETIPEAKFIVALRDPLTQIWSALNYPASTWGARAQSGFFREEDVRRSAEHWNKVSFFIQRDGYRERPGNYFLLEQEHLAEAT
ncbi:MAG: sulfotransferase, partial [Gammaproteobacteria bacterium]